VVCYSCYSAQAPFNVVRVRCRRRRWRALNTTSVHNHLDGWVPHADDQAMHVAEGCVHHYVTLAKSRKHQTFVQQVSATLPPLAHTLL
jgi:hypothetical protein